MLSVSKTRFFLGENAVRVQSEEERIVAQTKAKDVGSVNVPWLPALFGMTLVTSCTRRPGS